jgi:hypothetical protein
MSNRALIEIQDRQGVWIHFQKVANNASSINKALQAALQTPLASSAKKVRALEAGTNKLIKIENG